jgi:hypothetical protein
LASISEIVYFTLLRLLCLVADALRQAACIIRCGETGSQLATIEASILAAPPGLPDDRAMSYGLAIAALVYCAAAAETSSVLSPSDPLLKYDQGDF